MRFQYTEGMGKTRSQPPRPNIDAIKAAQATRAALYPRLVVMPTKRQRAPGKWTWPAVAAMIVVKTWDF